LRFDKLVQPVLDRHCVACHRPGVTDVQAAKVDLTPSHAYTTLLESGGGDLKKHAFERDRSLPGAGTAANSKLWMLLSEAGGHEGVRLDSESLSRVITWMDTYAQRAGHFSDEQETQLAAFRRECAALLQEENAP